MLGEKRVTVEPPIRVIVDQERMKKLGDDLVSAFNKLAEQARTARQQQLEAREVAALFELYRELRWLDSEHEGMRAEQRHARQDEIRKQLYAAMEGYDVRLLSDMATFGGWLADAAGKEWRKRD